MNKFISSGLALTLCAVGSVSMAQSAGTKPMMESGTMTNSDGAMRMGGRMQNMDMKLMDSNGDGMVSRAEFVKYHETVYDGMKKGSNGMISVKDMMAMDDVYKGRK